MFRLIGTSQSLEVVTSAAGNISVNASYFDDDTTTILNKSVKYLITTATTTSIFFGQAVGSNPATQLTFLSVFNASSSVVNTVTIQKKDTATIYPVLPSVTLNPGESVMYTQNRGFFVLDANGREKIQRYSNKVIGKNIPFYKIGTAPKAAAIPYCFSKDSGFPGAWAVGAPGLNGRATDGTTTTDAGCIPLWTPTGSLYLAEEELTATQAGLIQLWDFMWVNSGLVVTTTTAQAITPVALPARDDNGSTNGLGVQAALLVTTATTNAANITNCTISYTNSDGTAGRTGTMASFPLTANVGTLVFFQLQAGDRGVRSVQSVTLGTSLVTGAVSLVLMRNAASICSPLANTPSVTPASKVVGNRLYNGSCLLPVLWPVSATAVTIAGSVDIEER